MSKMSCSLAYITFVSFSKNEKEESPYPLVQLGYLDRDNFWLLVALKLEESRFVFNDLPEQERQQFFVVPRLGEVLAEALSQDVSDSLPGSHIKKPLPSAASS